MISPLRTSRFGIGGFLCVDENDNVITVENVDIFDGESFEEFCAKENLDPNEFEDVEVR